jgi:cyclophilin family peptidyl-prolyl cis-trans isomerase
MIIISGILAKEESMKYLMIVALMALACGVQKEKDTITKKETTPMMHILVQDYGEITIELFSSEAPKNVKNIIELAGKGFYNGLIFHRVIKGFVIQGGCPNGDGTGDPGYEIEDEISPRKKHLKGTVAMANRGPNTNGSQFYVCLEPLPRLDGGYTIIGQVVEGMDVVDRIGSVQTGQFDRPVEKVIMEKVWVEE